MRCLHRAKAQTRGKRGHAASIFFSANERDQFILRVRGKNRRPFRMNQEVTRLLVDWSGGDHGVAARLMPLVYEELRRLAGQYLQRERSDHTL